MKRHLLIVTLLFASCVGYTQDFKPFKVGLGLGYASPSDGGGGIAIYLEPAYRINDQIAVGLRIESAAMAKVVGTEEADVTASASYSVNGQYYFNNNNKFRPFVGLGLGLFSNASLDVEVNGTAVADIDPDPSFGFYPRVGFDFGHFNFIFDYNIIGATEGQSIDLGSSVIETDDVTNSYFAVKIGASIGGGRN